MLLFVNVCPRFTHVTFILWHPRCINFVLFFKIGIVGAGVQLDPLGTAATNRPIVLAPGDYDNGEIGGMIGRGNRSTRRIPASVPLCPPQTPHAARTRTLQLSLVRRVALDANFYTICNANKLIIKMLIIIFNTWNNMSVQFYSFMQVSLK
jgi:hypothetical protein